MMSIEKQREDQDPYKKTMDSVTTQPEDRKDSSLALFLPRRKELRAGVH